MRVFSCSYQLLHKSDYAIGLTNICIRFKRENDLSATEIEEAQAKLLELIERLTPGEAVVITCNQQPVAKLIGQQRPVRKPRRPGSAKGKLVILTEDNAHLEDFKEYVP